MSLEASEAAAADVHQPDTFRVTLDAIRARVVEVEYVVRVPLTVALVRLDNGWWLVGKSGSVDPRNFNDELGRQIALDDALGQAYALFAFAHAEAQQAPS